MVIAIDGPAGAGKSTASRELARRLGFFLLDTGAIYRAVALRAREADVAWDDGAGLGRLAQALPIRFDTENRVFIGEKDVSQAIRNPRDLTGSLDGVRPSRGARGPARTAAPAGSIGNCVVEGRDIGTVVLPDAKCKIFLTASPEVRAQRRFEELEQKGVFRWILRPPWLKSKSAITGTARAPPHL